MLTIDEIKKTVAEIAPKYNLKKVALFGSRANGTATDDSDVDLLVEFPKGSTLFDLIDLKFELEDAWNLEVDVIATPISEGSILIIEKEIALYAA
jgi:hypothetical protein